MKTLIKSGLIGYTGYVGSTLTKQVKFSHYFRSHDIESISNQRFDLLVCAGAPAKKWLANQQPEDDRAKITKLIRALSTVICNKFILISTVDVFKRPDRVDEHFAVDTNGLHPYGLHRRELEIFIKERFSHSLILRLPGLVGPGLTKNIIYDIHNMNNLDKIDSRSIFQFYPMVNLSNDIFKASELGLKLLHLTAEPISVSEVSENGFGIAFSNLVSSQPPSYNFQTKYAVQMGGHGHYTYSKRESLLAIRAYAQTEPKANLGNLL